MEINDTRWWIGWRPMVPILGVLLVGAVLGLAIEPDFTSEFNSPDSEAEPSNLIFSMPVILSAVGLLFGIGVAYWGAAEVNSKYETLLNTFIENASAQAEKSTGGFDTFRDVITRTSPMFIQPSKRYGATHLLFGDKSLVMNREFKYDMKDRQSIKGGSQEEIMYDQISNIYSQDYANYSELSITLSSGVTKTVTSFDPSALAEVKSNLQQRMRQAREAQ